MDGVPIGEAARQLGTSPEAIRKRISRRTMRGYKVDGQWYVILDESGRPDAAASGRSSGPTAEHPDRRPDGHPDSALYERLIQAKAAEVARLVEQRDTLIEQLAVKDEQLRQANVIIAQLSRRPPELPGPVRLDDETEPDQAQPVQAEASAPTRPWWRRSWLGLWSERATSSTPRPAGD